MTAAQLVGALLWFLVGIVAGWQLCRGAARLGQRHRLLNGVRARGERAGFRRGHAQGFRDAAELLGIFIRLLESVAGDPDSERAPAAAMAVAALVPVREQLQTTAESLEANRRTP